MTSTGSTDKGVVVERAFTKEDLRVLDYLYEEPSKLFEGDVEGGSQNQSQSGSQVPEALVEEVEQLESVLNHFRSLPEPEAPSPEIKRQLLVAASESAKTKEGLWDSIWRFFLAPRRRYVWSAVVSSLFLVGIGLSTYFMRDLVEPQSKSVGEGRQDSASSRRGLDVSEEEVKAEAKDLRKEKGQATFAKTGAISDTSTLNNAPVAQDVLQQKMAEKKEKTGLGGATGAAADGDRGGGVAEGRPQMGFVGSGKREFDDFENKKAPKYKRRRVKRPSFAQANEPIGASSPAPAGSKSSTTPLYTRAQALQKKGKHKSAVRVFEKLAKDPRYKGQGALYLSWAKSAMALGRYKEAKRLLVQASRQDPSLKVRANRLRTRLQARLSRARKAREKARRKKATRKARAKKPRSSVTSQKAF